MYKKLLNKQKKSIDKNFFYITVVLTVLGLIAVADASAPQALNIFNDKFYFLKQQSVWALIGFISMLIVSQINYKIWEKLAIPAFATSIIFLVAVLLPSLGSKFLGARRWIYIGSVSIQPAEFVKLSLAIYLAKVAKKEKQLLSYFVPLVIVVFLIMLQPDLGTTLVLLAIGMSQIFVSGINLFSFFAASVVGILGSLGFILTSSYRRARLLTFLQRSQDPLGKDYHIRQILLALGSGGIFGVGLGQSRQKFLFLPEAATDSVFAVIAEEIGFIGALIVIILLFTYIAFAFRIAKNAPDKFSKVLAIGITVWISTQVIFNIGSNVALVPLTGIPLPFFSYGGSALTMLLFASGILLNISKYEKK
ncbi:putative lipid II flippase FtsW [Patescibacteria group bacterium]|nr:putative lipid II flippase FtsW [Patescibacteria group bacterium]